MHCLHVISTCLDLLLAKDVPRTKICHESGSSSYVLLEYFGRFAFSDEGKTITKVSDHLSVASDGATYTSTGNTTVGSDGSTYVHTGSFSSDGSTRLGEHSTTGIGAIFNDRRESFSDC